jgi:hypothetical protein
MYCKDFLFFAPEIHKRFFFYEVEITPVEQASDADLASSQELKLS